MKNSHPLPTEYTLSEVQAAPQTSQPPVTLMQAVSTVSAMLLALADVT